MSELKRRLDQLRASSGAKPLAADDGADGANAGEQAPVLAELRERIQRIERKGGLAVAREIGDIADRLDGTWAAPGLLLIERDIPLVSGHGRATLDELKSTSLPPLGAPETPVDRLLFFDTETTGLAGGTGTLAFLLGLARVEGTQLRVRQLFLTGFAGEAAMLDLAAQWVSADTHLVSYNGKSFDLPVLETRYILSRMRPTFRDLPHLDLLHPNRRLFKGNFDSHKLVRMEQELLGFEREDDCPSAEVPMRYFQFARTSDPTHILPVLRHNAWDILSLVALTAHLAAVCDGDETPFAAARAAEYAGDLESAIAYYAASLDVATARAERLEAIEHAADCCRKLGRHGDAAGWWRRMLAEPRHRRLRPYVELAKILEHQQKDRPAASALIEEAIDLVRRGLTRPGPANSETSLAALEHRAHRLAGRVLSSQVLSSE